MTPQRGVIYYIGHHPPQNIGYSQFLLPDIRPPVLTDIFSMDPNESQENEQYLVEHNVPVLFDRMVRDILRCKPKDSTLWMVDWFQSQGKAIPPLEKKTPHPEH
eukprot:gene2195-2016_t